MWSDCNWGKFLPVKMCSMRFETSPFSFEPPSSSQSRNTSLPLCVRYILCIIMDKLYCSCQERECHMCNIGTKPSFDQKELIWICKCSKIIASTFSRFTTQGTTCHKEIIWNVFKYLHGQSWFQILKSVCHYILISVNSLILFPLWSID